jgi:hypothetical protein
MPPLSLAVLPPMGPTRSPAAVPRRADPIRRGGGHWRGRLDARAVRRNRTKGTR